MDHVEALVDALKLCIPQLDPEPLLARRPDDTDEDTVLHWLYEHLDAQKLMVYEEWKEFFGDLPELAPLTGLDLSAYDDAMILNYVVEWGERIGDEEALGGIQYNLPYLEYMNHFICPYGVRLMNLCYENSYIFCVKNDRSLIEKLSKSLKIFNIEVNDCSEMNGEQAKAYIDGLAQGLTALDGL